MTPCEAANAEGLADPATQALGGLLLAQPLGWTLPRHLPALEAAGLSE